jgi:hypothetical protein
MSLPKPLQFIPLDKLLIKKIDTSVAKRTPFSPIVKFGLIGNLTAPTLPEVFDLKSEISEVYNQSSLNSCVASAVCMAFQVRQTNKAFKPSRLQLYYNSRKRENSADIRDTGTHSDAALKQAEEHGICSEELWPYLEENVNIEPPSICDVNASLHKLSGIFELYDPDPKKRILNIQQALFHHRLIILIGISAYKSFLSAETKNTGHVSIPQCSKQNYYDSSDPNDPFLGGHEMCIVGYNFQKRYFICLNSFGTEWGDQGFCYLPFEYIENKYLTLDLCSFFNVIEPKTVGISPTTTHDKKTEDIADEKTKDTKSTIAAGKEIAKVQHNCLSLGCVCKFCHNKLHFQ